MIVVKVSCAAIAAVAHGAMPNHGRPMQPRVILCYDRHGDVVPVEVVEPASKRLPKEQPTQQAMAVRK